MPKMLTVVQGEVLNAQELWRMNSIVINASTWRVEGEGKH